jgi:uncharacterized protein (DUF58 family)
VDNSGSMAWGQPSKWLAARRLASALGYLALNHGDRLIAAGLEAVDRPFGPAHGKGRLPGLLRFARTLPLASDRPVDLTAAAHRYARAQRRAGLVILISDLLAVPDLPALLSAFPGPAWQVLVIHLLHPAELDPTLRGELELRDVETGEQANYDLTPARLQRYREQVRAWCQRLEEACFDHKAAYARVLADWPIERAVLPYLQRRGVVRRA